MSARTLSKSDYKIARGCDAKLWFKEHGYPNTMEGNAYLGMLAQGGYMVEALACARRDDGIHLEYGRDLAADFARTMELLQRENVTLFQATLLYNRRMARVDILEKRGNTIRLLEVKAKSFDGVAHAGDIADGGVGILRAKRKPHGVLQAWTEKVEDIAFQTIMLERVLPGVSVKPYLVLVDTSKRSTIDDVPSLFEILRNDADRVNDARYIGTTEQLDQLDVITEVDVSAEVAMVREMVDAEATRFEGLLDAPFRASMAVLGAKCGGCEYRTSGGPDVNGFAKCWGAMADVSPHALELVSIGTVKDSAGSPMIETLAAAGTVSLFDIPVDALAKKDGSVGAQAIRQRRQIEYTRSGQTWMSDELGVKLSSLQYPLHFIDFEASRLALPYHSNMRCYGQVAFQWSCHTVDAPGATPRHSEWLNGDPAWPNLTFAATLRQAVGDAGSVLTWTSYEASQLREIVREHEVFAARDEALVAWVDDLVGRRMFDLHKCATNDYYHPGMRGRTSIKVVLDGLWKADPAMREQFTTWTNMPTAEDLDPYHALPDVVIAGVRQEVREGTGAVKAYEAMMYGVEKHDAEAKAAWRQLLLEYCKLDTLSMVLVFEHWRRVTGLTSVPSYLPSMKMPAQVS